MSSVPITPAPVQRPQAVPLRQVPERPRRVQWLVWIFIVLAIVGIGASWRFQARKAELAAGPQIRTAIVVTGSIESILRLNGSTGAENYVSMNTPQLRGSRNGPGLGTATSATTAVRAISASGSSSVSGTSAATTTAQAGSGQGSNLSTALQASTNRFSSPTATAKPASSAPPVGGTPTATLGNSGLGSTSGTLVSTSMFGNPDSYSLLLQHLAKPGSRVAKGAVVAEFDRLLMLNRLDDYKAQVSQAEAALIRQRAELALTHKAHDQQIATAQGTLDKARLDLKKAPVLSAIDAERYKLAVDEADARYKELLSETKYVEASERAQLRSSEIDLQQAKIELKRAETNANKMIVKAPIGGLVVMQNIFRGSEFTPIQQGDQLWPGQFFMSIVDTRSMVVNAVVNQADVKRLHIGYRAAVRFDAYSDLTLPARVYSVAGLGRSGGSRGNYLKEIPVRLKIENTDPRLIPDLSVSVEVMLASEKQVPVAPLAGIFHDNKNGKPYVFVQKSDGWERRTVVLGLANNGQTAIRAGLKADDVIALEPPQTRGTAKN